MTEVLLNTQAMRKDFALTRLGAHRQKQDIGNFGPVLSSAEVGWLSTDLQGQVRYFGYTSNLQVVLTLPLVSPHSPVAAHHNEAYNHKEMADLEEFQAHLVDLYFTYQNPALPIVQKEAFMEGLARRERSPYFSQFLLHCILARSARLSDRPYAVSLIPLYAKRIKSELLNEIDNPDVTTIQALCLYGHFLGSIGDDRGCWLYPGMAFRLAYDMGLHRDCLHLVQTGKLTARDRQLRISTFWGCYVLDKIYSVCQGRPSTIKIKDVSIPRPSKDTVGSQYQLLSAWVDLSLILDDMNAILNGSPGDLDKDANLKNLSEVADNLLLWLRSLPPDLCWNKKDFPAPEVCALHTQVLIAIVLIHRPFANSASSTTETPTTQKKQLPGYSAVDSRNICTENSIRIAKMIDAFRRQYGIQKIFSVAVYLALTAGMTLVSNVTPSAALQRPHPESKKALDVCLDALSDLSPSFPTAGRHHAILKSILKSCGHQHQLDRDRATTNSMGTRSTPRDVDVAPQIHCSTTQRRDKRNHNSAGHENFVPVMTQPVVTAADVGHAGMKGMGDYQHPDPNDNLDMRESLPETFTEDLTQLSYQRLSSEFETLDRVPASDYTESMQNHGSIYQGQTGHGQQIYDKINDLMMDGGTGIDPSMWDLPPFSSDSWMTEMEASSPSQMFASDGFNMTMADVEAMDQLGQPTHPGYL
ncbi:Fungal specific transcription factor domain-containing protein [Cladophialophora immunda]|nr:Fungal specific transcription factor domain-containing protein [Cladophialophora immunda]